MVDFGLTSSLDTDTSKAQSKVSTFLGQTQAKFTKMLSSISAGLQVASVATFAGLVLAMVGGTAAAVKFENEFANVKKTMNDVKDPQVFKEIEKDLLNLAQQIPVMAGELAGIAAVGGQLGVGAGDIAKFTEVVAKLGTATNMTAEQAATSMARFLNVTNESTDQIGKYAAVLVELGNSTAATEGEIIMLAQNFGATGTLAGLSTEEILAFSAAMRETGQQSQAGATALTKLFRGLSDAAKIGGKEMAVFAETAGMDVHQFRRLIETDIGEAATIFLGGINNMGASGQSTTAILDELGLGTERVSRAILSLANNEEGLADARARAIKQAVTQNALNDEAAQKFETAAMQIQQIKAALNAAAITLGQTFLPVFKVFLEFILGVVAALQGLAELFNEFPALFVALTVGTGSVALAMKTAASEVTTFSAAIGNAAKAVTKFSIIATVVVGAFVMMGKAYKKFKEDIADTETIMDATTDILDKIKIDLTNGFKADPIQKEDWADFLQNLPEATRDAVEFGVKQGFLGADVFDALVSGAKDLPPEFTQLFADVIDLDEGFFGRGDLDVVEVQKMLKMIEDSGNSSLDPLKETLEQYLSLITKSDKASREQRETLMEILKVQFGIVDATKEELAVRNKEISKELNDHFGILVKTDKRIRDMMSTEEGRLKLARDLAKQGLQPFVDLLGDANEEADALADNFEQVESNIDVLVRMANDFRSKVDNLFAPLQEQFEMQQNEMDLVKAHETHAKLHEEQNDLTQEDLDLQKELTDLASADLRTAEEKVEMQELENEAVEIEKRLREDMALSANDQLRKEKLKKELARVNAAAAQGSLEFADLEKKAIEEQIAEIDAKALTQKDADDKRAEASKISQTAEERRLERINEVEERRIEIGERLKEIPRDIKEAHFDIHKLQRDLVNNQLDLIEAQAKYNTMKEDELRMTAELLGMNMTQIDGLMTLMNHNRVESSIFGQGYIDQLIGNLPQLMSLLGYGTGNSATGPQAANLIRDWNYSGGSFANMKPTYRHAGGSFMPGKNYVVGEYGPETLKAFPGGGGMITPMDSGSRGSTVNNVTLNVTGLPSDPIAARRTAQLIQKELNKLKSDGRSGVVR